jgi:hypothetical protein
MSSIRRQSSNSNSNNNNNNKSSSSSSSNNNNRNKKKESTSTSRRIDDDDDTLNAKPLQPPQRSTTSNTASAAAAAGGVTMIRPPTFSSVNARRPPPSSQSVDLSLLSDEDGESYVHDYHEHIAKMATTPSLNNNNNHSTPVNRRPPNNNRSQQQQHLPSSNASESTTSTAMPPPLAPIARQQSTPGAVAVTGVFTNPRNLEYENNDYSDIETIATRWSLPSIVGDSNQMTNLMMSSLSQPPASVEEPEAHIVTAAELAPDEGDVAARVAERISADMTERLKREVQQQLDERQQQQQQHPNQPSVPIVAAERMPEECPSNPNRAPKTTNSSAGNNNNNNNNSNFKICGVRRSCWGIWMLFLLFVAVGAGVGIFFYQQQVVDNGAEPKEDDDKAPSTPRQTASPTAAPTPDTRREDILAVLGPYILPQSEADLETPGSPQYRALNWMVQTDTYSTIPKNDNVIEDDAEIRFLVERYALVVFYFTNAAAVSNNPTTNWNLEISSNVPLQRRFGTISHCDWNTDVGLLITETNNEDDKPQGMFCYNDDDEIENNVVTDLQFGT